MIEIWIPITIAAAFFQNLRSALQKHLKGQLSTSGAAYARFVYALPVSLIYILLLNDYGGYHFPAPNTKFFLFCAIGGICQILFTVFLLWLFSLKSFAVGTTFSKLEVIMVAVLSVIFLGDTLNAVAILAIILSSCGIVALSLGQANISVRAMLDGLGQKSTAIGLACAAWLGGSVVFFRGASLSLGHEEFLMAAAYTLFVSLVIQTVVMGVYIAYREPGQLGKVLTNWRWAGSVGFTGALASIAWFTAFTIQNASYVRALGQVELIFTFIATTMIFKEKVSSAETWGIILVAGGIMILLVFA